MAHKALPFVLIVDDAVHQRSFTKLSPTELALLFS